MHGRDRSESTLAGRVERRISAGTQHRPTTYNPLFPVLFGQIGTHLCRTGSARRSRGAVLLTVRRANVPAARAV